MYICDWSSDVCSSDLPRPPVAAPDPIITFPLSPPLAVPELNTNIPLVPDAPALADRIFTVPLLVAVPSPLSIDTDPPAFVFDPTPATTEKLPPPVPPKPADTDTAPPVAAVDDPAVTVTEPPFFDAPDPNPDEIVVAPPFPAALSPDIKRK